MRLLHLFCLALLLSACGHRPAAPPTPAPVLLISIDGFRPDYLDRGLTPALSALARGGATGAMRPAFPSLTFPNHYTLVTGLHPDQHGIVGNVMQDPAMPGVTFTLGDRTAVTDRRWWDGATPLWVSAERAGLRTATMFWPGSEAAIQGVRPSDWKVFDQAMPSAARVDQVLVWMARPPQERPGFATLYFDLVDTAGHRGGPDGAEVNAALSEVDRAIARLVEGLNAQGLAGKVNLVIVSDHGMAAVSPERVIVLDGVVDPTLAAPVTLGALAGVNPAPGRVAEAEAKLLGKHAHMECWRKGEIPARLRYGAHRRVPAIACLAEPGWVIASAARPYRATGGAHGYDSAAPDMAAVFIANGPAFAPGTTLGAFDAVDVYPLLAKLVGVAPEAHAGSLGATAPALLP